MELPILKIILDINNKPGDPLRAVNILMIMGMSQTTVSATKASSVTLTILQDAVK